MESGERIMQGRKRGVEDAVVLFQRRGKREKKFMLNTK